MTVLRALGIYGQADDKVLQFAAQLGCDGVVVHLPRIASIDGAWDAGEILETRQRVESWGLRLYSLENTSWDMYEEIMVGGVNASLQLDKYCETIRRVGSSGVGVMGFCWMPNSVWSSGFKTIGRGRSRVRTFRHEDHTSAPATHGRDISSEVLWRNLERFVHTTVPVAEEAGVKLAVHPDDPPIGPLGGVDRILSSRSDFDRLLFDVCDSSHLAINFCLGSWAEQGSDVVQDLVHFLGAGKVAYAHVRDVIGAVPEFRECFLGEGSLDVLGALQALEESEQALFIEEDHVPIVVGDDSEGMLDGGSPCGSLYLGDEPGDQMPWGQVGRAYAQGYLEGALASIRAPRL